jgi:hypothetical protein
MQISTDCNKTEHLLESFQEVLTQVQKKYKGKQVSYNCARKYLQNKPEFFFYASGISFEDLRACLSENKLQ